jgi:chromosome segregation ATPase
VAEPKPPGEGGRLVVSAGTIGTRIWDFISRLATLSADQRRQTAQLDKLNDQVAALARRLEQLSGQHDSIEKRLDDKDKLTAAQIELAIARLQEKLREQGKG